MSGLNYDLSLTPIARSGESDSEQPPRLRSLEWRNPKGGSSKQHSAPQPSRSQLPTIGPRRSTTSSSSLLSPSARPSGSGIRDPDKDRYQQPTSGSNLQTLSGQSLQPHNYPTGRGTDPSSPATAVRTTSTASAPLERKDAFFGEYFDSLPSPFQSTDGGNSLANNDKARRYTSGEAMSSSAFLRYASRESATGGLMAPWLAHISSGSVLSDGDDEEDAEHTTAVPDILMKPPSREGFPNQLSSYLSFLLDTGVLEITSDQNSADACSNKGTSDAAAADNAGEEAELIRLNTFSPVTSDSEAEDDEQRPKTPPDPAAPVATPLARRRRQQRVSFKPQVEEVMSVDPSPRSFAYSNVVFRNPTIRELGYEMQQSPAQVRRRLVRDRPNAVHAVVVLSEDTCGAPLLVACGTHVRVYPTMSSREVAPPIKHRNSSSRRASATNRRTETVADNSGQAIGFDDFERAVTVDEAVSRPSGSSEYASVALDELQEVWLNGRNTCLILCASKARDVDAAFVAKQFLASAASELSMSLREEAGAGSWFEMKLVMGEAFDVESDDHTRSCEVRDLLATPPSSGGASTTNVRTTISAFYGPTVEGLVEKVLVDGASATLQNLVTQGFIQFTRDTQQWSTKHGGKPGFSQPVCFAQVHLKTVREAQPTQTGARATTPNRGAQPTKEVFLSSLLIVFAGTSPVTLRTLATSADEGRHNNTKARHAWASSNDLVSTLLSSALGGHTRTAVCACLSDCDATVAVDWLDALSRIRRCQNEPPLTGNVQAFTRYLRLAIDSYIAEHADENDNGEAVKAAKVDMERLTAKLNQLRRFLKDPTLPVPKLSFQSVIELVNRVS